MNLEHWIEHYRPIDNCSADSFGFVCDDHERIVHHVTGVDLEAVHLADPDKVWTLIESDGVAMIVNGYHHVNREGYLITEMGCHDKDLEILIDENEEPEINRENEVDYSGYVTLDEASALPSMVKNSKPEDIEARSLNCANGCQLYPSVSRENPVKAYFDGERFSHFYCSYCGDSCVPNDDNHVLNDDE